jgi:flagella basal body P-ring formation protein FlgA
LVIFLLTVALNAEKREIIVKLKENATVSGTVIKIKDIGMVIGDSRLANLALVKFSSQSDSFLINKQLVLNEIVNFYQKINEPVPPIRIFSKDIVKIKRKSFFVTEKTISSIIRDFLKTNEEKIFRGKKWKILKIITQNKIKLPTDKVDIKVSLIDEKNFFRLPFVVEFLDKNSNKIRAIRAYAIIEAKETVVVATKNIFMRKAILPDMVELKEVAIKNNNYSFFKSLNQVVGKISKRYIRKGEPISSEIVQVPPMVKRGEIVNVIAQSSGISISTKGKVLENGFYDKPVKVLNLSSGKVFSAVVKGYGEVVVNF